jgi:hypothetical protein
MSGRFEVQTYTFCDGWVNCWHASVNGGEMKPETFETLAEAQEAISDHLDDSEEAAREDGDGYDRDGERGGLRIIETLADGTTKEHSA